MAEDTSTYDDTPPDLARLRALYPAWTVRQCVSGPMLYEAIHATERHDPARLRRGIRVWVTALSAAGLAERLSTQERMRVTERATA